MKLSAGVVIIREEPDGCRFLLLRVFNYWDFPKGEVESGEEPLAAAVREVAEETGITDLEFPRGEAFFETEPYGSGRRRKVARYYLAFTRQKKVVLPVNPELGKPEHEEYRWAGFQEALGLLGERVEKVLRWAASESGCAD
ncbi:MAG TPA: NUDIX domain-containing protein [Chromatiaceae bacterium]|nr:NUDIX domain-containing protein [Chromatiaceae bacterium]